MKKAALGMTAFAFVALAATTLVRADEKTITGRLADTMCATDGKNDPQSDGDACAMACAKRGEPMVIVTKDGGVYTVTGKYTDNKNEKMLSYVAKNVVAKGEVTEKDGKKMIEVTSLEAMKSK